MLKKGKTTREGRSEEGDKNGEKIRKEGWGRRRRRGGERERPKSFFCQEQLFHIYRRDTPRACFAEEGVGLIERDEAERDAFFPLRLECAAI
jgi:hypothetical protein